MFYKVFYDGFALHDHCIINRIVKSTAPRRNTFLSNKYASGASFKHTRLDPLEIELLVTIKDDVQYHIDEINRILSVREPKMLLVAQTPERQLLCIPSGNIEPSSFLRNSEFKISFEAVNPYWGSTEGPKPFVFHSGHVVAENKGNYPTHPKFNFVFHSDCGFIGIVAPNGYLYIGDPEEADTVKTPNSEYAINGFKGFEGVNMSQFNYMATFNRASYAPSISGDTWRLNPKNDWSGQEWYGHGYVKEFNAGQIEAKGAENFEFNLDGIMTHKSSNTDALGMILVMILDQNEKPMMSTMLYDSKRNSNGIDIQMALRDEEGRLVSSKYDEFKTFDGSLYLNKVGNQFNWSVSSSGGYIFTKTNPGVSQPKIGDTTYIKSSARFGYDHVGNRYTIKDFTRGRAYKITDSKIQRGVRRYLIEYQGVGVYWMDLDDLTGGKVEPTVERVRAGFDYAVHSAYNSSVAQRTASKLLVFIGRWGEQAQTYSDLAISNPRLRRIYTSAYKDIPNAFKSGDVLTIDNETGQILHNFKPIKAPVDVDSRFFEIDGGKTDIRLLKSSWAQYPTGIVQVEDRWY